jgi:hypothetical protein
MHPDQSTPDSHRYTASDSEANRPHAPEADQDDDAIETEDDAAPAAQEVDEGARVAEAGNAYVGRELDDALKSSPRVEDGDEAVDEDPTTPGDD